MVDFCNYILPGEFLPYLGYKVFNTAVIVEFLNWPVIRGERSKEREFGESLVL